MTEARDFWNEEAAKFDEEPDHGLLDPAVRTAWRRLLEPALPESPARIVDLGCGTGSVSVLLAELGHDVQGVDIAERMIDAANAKAAIAASTARFAVGDAAAPPVESGAFDVVFARHVLWAMPNPSDALRNWLRLLRPGGELVLVEGRWGTGAGITAAECRAMVLRHRAEAAVQHLPDPTLWGRTIADERYLLISSN